MKRKGNKSLVKYIGGALLISLAIFLFQNLTNASAYTNDKETTVNKSQSAKVTTNNGLPDRIFAPYVDVMLYPQFSVNNCYEKTGQKYFTLAFITSDGSGNAAWGGVVPLSENYYMEEINNLRKKGGDIIISFGGANGVELACSSANTDASVLQSKYQAVIDKYKPKWVDFDIEGAAVADRASIDRRNKAIKGLQKKNPGLTIAYCLPALPSGLTNDGIYVLENAKANGVRVDVVNVMAMDYGSWAAPNPDGRMGDYAIETAKNTYEQCKQIGLNTKIGITPMIGRNDVASEVFYPRDAEKLVSWANSTSWVKMLSMWSSTRDNGSGGALPYASPTCSSLVQAEFEFTNKFKSFTSSSNPTPAPNPQPDNDSEPEQDSKPDEKVDDRVWKPNTTYKVGDIVTYEGKKYKCIQGHTSLSTWQPPIVPALWQVQ